MGGTWKHKYLEDLAVDDVRASFGGSLLQVEKLSYVTEWKQSRWLVSAFFPADLSPRGTEIPGEGWELRGQNAVSSGQKGVEAGLGDPLALARPS